MDALDQSSGLEAAVEEAQSAIFSSITVARCVPTGICVTKLGISVFNIMNNTRLRFHCCSRFALVVTCSMSGPRDSSLPRAQRFFSDKAIGNVAFDVAFIENVLEVPCRVMDNAVEPV